MHIPLISLITLATELVVTACVYTIVWRAWRTGHFMSRFAFAVLAYEFLFNVSYMFSREVVGARGAPKLDPYLTILAIFHGVFSLLMFILLVTFFIAAWQKYRTGENFFLVHKRLTVTFLTAWTISILSGISLFLQLYVF